MEFKSRKKRKDQVSFSDEPKSSWLDEEKEWERLRHSVKSDTNTKKSSAFDELPDEDLRKVEVNIKLSLPKVNVARFKNVNKITSLPKQIVKSARQKFSRKSLLIGSLALILIVAGIVVGNKYLLNDNKPSKSGVLATDGASEFTNDPKFEIVKPKGRDIAREKIVYDPKRNFAKYEDDINGTPVTVSQQPLPETFKADPASGAAKVAKDFGATEELLFEQQKMYYGIDEKGPQTLIFTKNNLLVFIATSKEVEKQSLQVYAGNLD